LISIHEIARNQHGKKIIIVLTRIAHKYYLTDQLKKSIHIARIESIIPLIATYKQSYINDIINFVLPNF